MEALLDYQILTSWLMHYGSVILFILLALGILALPIPEETLMIIAGVLMVKGYLLKPSTLIAAYGGSVCGITMSYILGRTAGFYLLQKSIVWLGLNEKYIQVAHEWFERYGKWTLVVGYFVPGLRHFTGLSAGITQLKYPIFAIFAYLGALLWASTFLAVGYFLGETVLTYIGKLDLSFDDLLTVLIITAVFLGLYYLRRSG